MTAVRRPSPIARNLEAENASLRAELALAQQRTRDVEAARQRLAADIAEAAKLADKRRAAVASAAVSLIRNAGVADDVLDVLGALRGWHRPSTKACEIHLYGESDDDDD